MCFFDFKIICLTETWLNESLSIHFHPPPQSIYYISYCKGRYAKLHDGGDSTVSKAVSGVKRRFELEYFQENVWVYTRITVTDGHN
jgi:hypothetical protein